MNWLRLNKPLLNYQQRLTRLRLITALLFLLLFVPASLISYFGFQQLHKETLLKYQRQTEKVTVALNKRFFKKLANTNAIRKEQFEYYFHVYNPLTDTLTKTLSPLADTSSYKDTAGLLGYFQQDLDGGFNSPVWPYPLDSVEDNKSQGDGLSDSLSQRRLLAVELRNIVQRSGQYRDFIAGGMKGNNGRFYLFTDVPNYLIFYRVVALNGETKLQGYVLERTAYLTHYVTLALNAVEVDVPLAVTLKNTPKEASEPFHTWYFASQKGVEGNLLVERQEAPALELSEQHLGRQTLNWPYANTEISYSTSAVNYTPQGIYNLVLSLVLLLAMVFACFGFYRIGIKQLRLAEQRLNFVSSVSHELKTPLTSIRMYAEMLQSGQVMSAQHQKDYYDFIFSESERLSRLIDNILQLAKLSQPQQSLAPKYIELSVIKDTIRSKVSSMLGGNGFELKLTASYSEPDKVKLFIDPDAFSQIVINIVDNSVKFFDHKRILEAERKRIDVSFYPDKHESDRVVMEIRDYGIGIEPEQENKLFELFYRGGDELTRTTQGTGIGLALVQELVAAQEGRIKLQRMSPGLALQVSLKAQIDDVS